MEFTMKLSFHPFAEEYPLMPAEDLARLVNDMKQRGFDARFPIWLYQKKILDGRNRQLAADEAGIQPAYHVFEGTEDEAKTFVIRANEHRRHLNLDWLKKLRKERIARVQAAREEGETIRDIAAEEGVDPKTIRDDLGDRSPKTDNGESPEKSGGKGKEKKLCDRCKRAKRVGQEMPKNCVVCKDLNKSDKPTNTKTSAPDKPAPKDAFGNEVPKRCRSAYGDPFITEAIDCMAVAEAAIRKARLADRMIKRKDFYPFITSKDFVDGVAMVMNTLDQLIDHLKEHRPAGVCRACSGEGCKTCKYAGMLPRTKYIATKG